MKCNMQALQAFKDYVAQNGQPKTLRTINETLYNNKVREKYRKSKVIPRELTVSETFEQ